MTPTSEELLVQIRNQITAYQMNVKSDNKAHRYNINDRAEAFSIPLLKLIFDWDQLQDLNRISINYPGIDLGDYKNRVAVQVTSDTSFDKVKSTITQFVGNALYDDFDRLVILMIQERNQKYNQKTIDTLCEGRLRFDQKNDVLDLSDLVQIIKGLLVPDLNKVLAIFHDETGFVEKNSASPILETARVTFSAPSEPPFESGLLNLCKVGFPDTIYSGYWNFSKKQLGTRKRNDRKLVQEALQQQGLKFSTDWVTIEKQIFTFHDLSDPSLPLAKVVDQGTVTELDTSEFFENPFYRNTFTELLQRCLQQKLYRLGIHWQHIEKEYIFVPDRVDDAVREIEWKGVVADTRKVYRKIPDLKDSTKVYCHEHFAFTARFFEFEGQWFLAVTPDWFYSRDGFQRAWYAIEDKRKYKKLVETNQHVSTHVRFIHSFISSNNPGSDRQIDMFTTSGFPKRPYEYLWVKSLLDIKQMPRLPDSKWRPLSTTDSDDSETMF